MARLNGIEPILLASEIAARLRALPNQRTPAVRQIRREYTRRLVKADAHIVLELAFQLLEQPGWLPRLMAYELVHHHRAALGNLGTRHLHRMGRGLDCWAAVDTFACYLAGPVWRERQVPDNVIHRWAHSPDRWWRRTALVSTVPLNNKARGGRGDPSRTLAVCRLLVQDRDDMVVKAMSWALRELAKREPAAVRGFLAEFEGALAARVVREVQNKLSTGRKNPRQTKRS